MYLTKLILPLTNRSAAEALGDCQKMHRLITGLFGRERSSENLLYRVHVVRGSLQAYLYSEDPVQDLPEEIQLAGQRDLTSWLEAMQTGDRFGFDLLASPCKKVYQAERDRNSQRRVLREPEQRLQWMQRRAEQNGFRLLQMQETEQSHSYGRHRAEKGGAMHLDAYHYQGMLEITDPEPFRRAVMEGIGPGKAYGLGMLMLKGL